MQQQKDDQDEYLKEFEAVCMPSPAAMSTTIVWR
jgi:hypothetical protein